jgi:hypothetical protein
MVTAIKQLVRVEAGGRVSMQSAELHEGESVEVIVMVERTNPIRPEERLNALNQLRQNLKLTPAAASQWEADVQAERSAWRDPPVQ